MGKKKDKQRKHKLPVRQLPASRGDKALTKREEQVVMALIEGGSVASIAKELVPDDDPDVDRKRKAVRSWIRRLSHDVVFQEAVGKAARSENVLGLGPAAYALNKKARNGRVDAIKLLFESTGFFNPRVSHDHGGEVTITIRNAPRPEKVTEEYAGANTAGMPRPDEVVDAEVVEE